MTEIEQLRKEVNELRERVAQLEWNQRKSGPFGPPNVIGPYPSTNPWPTITPNIFPYSHDVWCSTTTKDE